MLRLFSMQLLLKVKLLSIQLLELRRVDRGQNEHRALKDVEDCAGCVAGTTPGVPCPGVPREAVGRAHCALVLGSGTTWYARTTSA